MEVDGDAMGLSGERSLVSSDEFRSGFDAASPASRVKWAHEGRCSGEGDRESEHIS